MTKTRSVYAALILFVVVLFVTNVVYARDKPPAPNTGVFVSDIDNDWVELSILPGEDGFWLVHQADELLNKVYTNEQYGSEVMNTAAFACDLYNREAVYLSVQFEEKRNKGITFVLRMRFLFACAMP